MIYSPNTRNTTNNTLRTKLSNKANQAKQKPVLPTGIFRGYFRKSFYRKDAYGNTVKFLFEIRKEYNYCGDGYNATGYFIYILDAPNLENNKYSQHQYHILHSDNGDPYICWSQNIKDFEKANAVMITWVKAYMAEYNGESNEMKRGILPCGTFRSEVEEKSEKEIEGESKMNEEIKEVEESKEVKMENKETRIEENISTEEVCTEKEQENQFQISEEAIQSVNVKKEEKRNFSRKNKSNKTRKNWKFWEKQRERISVQMNENVFDKIMSILGTKKPELGGMLGYSKDFEKIDTFVFDKNANANYVEYSPNTNFLNSIIQGEWNEKDINLCGFVHSHPGSFQILSYADVEYAQRICQAFNIPHLFMPIVTSDYDCEANMIGYAVTREGQILDVDIEIIESEIESTETEKTDNNKEENMNLMNENDTFARIRNVIDIEHMNDCTIIGVGCGGAKSFYESMARMGVGKFILIDGDTSSMSNIASQNARLSEVGMFKTEALKNRILDINENCEVICISEMLTDEMDDEWIEENILQNVDTGKVLLCAFTDDYLANLRCSKIAVKYCIPLLNGAHHENGDSSEVFFYMPGLTRYSYRDATFNRLEVYKDGFKNTVTSVGSPIYNTTRLNSICEKLAMGMLLFEVMEENSCVKAIYQLRNKNFALLRQKPIDIESITDIFTSGSFDNLVWLSPLDIQNLFDVTLDEDLEIEDTRNLFEGIEEI